MNQYKNVTVIENAENLGFGKGCNEGEKKTKGKYVLFLNSDTIALNKGFIEMADFLQKHQEAAVIGGKMKNPNGSTQLSAWKFYTLWNLLFVLLGFERFGLHRVDTSDIARVDWVTGGCMMVNKAIFEKLGGFDKEIFMYIEDMEYCFRAKKRGYLTYFFPFTDIIHTSHASSNKEFAVINIYKNILYFYKKHFPYWQYIVARFLLRIKAQALFIIGKASGNSYFINTYGKIIAIS